MELFFFFFQAGYCGTRVLLHKQRQSAVLLLTEAGRSQTVHGLEGKFIRLSINCMFSAFISLSVSAATEFKSTCETFYFHILNIVSNINTVNRILHFIDFQLFYMQKQRFHM